MLHIDLATSPWMGRFDREVNDGPAHLNGFVVARQQRSPLLDKHQRAKLTLVIFEHELPILKFDFSVAS